MKTAQEARQSAVEVIAKRGYAGIRFVVTENKLSRNTKKTWFGFRAMVNENFSGEWKQLDDGSFCRMIETI